MRATISALHSFPQHLQPVLRRHFLQAFQQGGAGALMSGLSSFARVCIRLIIARDIVGVAIISFVSTGAICKAVWQMVG